MLTHHSPPLGPGSDIIEKKLCLASGGFLTCA